MMSTPDPSSLGKISFYITFSVPPLFYLKTRLRCHLKASNACTGGSGQGGPHGLSSCCNMTIVGWERYSGWNDSLRAFVFFVLFCFFFFVFFFLFFFLYNTFVVIIFDLTNLQSQPTKLCWNFPSNNIWDEFLTTAPALFFSPGRSTYAECVLHFSLNSLSAQ